MTPQQQLDHASEVIHECERTLAAHDRVHATLIHIFPRDGLCFDGEAEVEGKESQLRNQGYTVTRHQTSKGNPYIKAVPF